MPFRYIQFEASAEGIATVKINRPEKRNALNRETMSELAEAWEMVAHDSAIKAVIVTGAGEKAFVAGADIGELSQLSPAGAEELSRYGQRVFRRLESLRKPSVAAVNGAAFGGGLELALCCTVRFAVPEAMLGQPEVKLGIIPGYGATQRLPRLIGRGRALEMLLSAEAITAEEGRAIGLINRVIPATALLAEARAWLSKCLQNSTSALGMIMEAVDSDLEQGLRFESAAFGLVASSVDCKEGFAAFLEKRKPVFTGS